jgi:hypothetical protein
VKRLCASLTFHGHVSPHPKHFLSDKVEHFTESVIREMTRQAMQYGASTSRRDFPILPRPPK